MKLKLFTALMLFGFFTANAQVGIGTTEPDASAILHLESSKRGLLIPRMTITARDSINAPAEGLQIYNLTHNSSDIFSNGTWKSFSYSEKSNLVYVYSLSDLPTPASSAITLDATKMYVFSGAVDISPNYIIMNGAGLRGTDPQKDIIISNVSGAVLRSVDSSVFMENLAVIPNSGSSKAYDFSDATGTKFCNIFSGCSVVEINASLGVGQISGFKAITISKNYWKVTDGVKIAGNVGKFASAYNFIENISNGAGIELLSGLTVNDIDLSNNYFIYPGQTGIKVNAGASVDRGRLTTNMFREVGTPLEGIDSYSRGWNMIQNTNIPDSRAFSFIYFNNNSLNTSLPSQNVFYRIAGATTTIDEKRFTTADNKITYNGVDPITGKIFVTIGAKAPSNNSDFSIAIAINGLIIPAPFASMAAAGNGQSFQIILNTEVDLVNGDFIEVGIRRNNNNTSSVKVEELQFRVTD